MDDSSSVASDSSSSRKPHLTDDDALAPHSELEGICGGIIEDIPVPMELEAAWEQFQDQESESMDDQTVQLPALSPMAASNAVSSAVEALDIPAATSPGSLPSPDSAAGAQVLDFTDIVMPNPDGSKSNLPWPSTQGRAYDLSKVDDKLRKRLLKNRLSAERSRQRKQAHVETLEFELSCCRSENEHLKKRVAALEQQLATALSLSTSQAAAAAASTATAPALRPQVAV